MKRFRRCGRMAALLAIGLLTTCFDREAAAKPAYLPAVPNGNVFSCATCHNPDLSRNAFGTAIEPLVAMPQSQWWPAVRGLDPDGDGQTSRQELGDPCSSWSMGQTPDRTTDISNPGEAQSQSADPDGPGCGSSSSSTSTSTSASASASSTSSASTTTGAGGAGQGGSDPGDDGVGGSHGHGKKKDKKKPKPSGDGSGGADNADDADDEAEMYVRGPVDAESGPDSTTAAACSGAPGGPEGPGSVLACVLYAWYALSRRRRRRID